MKTCVFELCDFLPIYPVTIDHSHNQDRIARPHGARFHQIFIVSGGSGYACFGEDEYSLKKGDMFFIRKGIGHIYGGGKEFVTSYLGFDGEICENIFKYYGVGDCGVYLGKNFETAETLICDFYNDFDNMGGFDMMSSRTYSAVMTFFNKALNTEPTPIEKVRNYLEVNYSRPVTLADILEFYPYSKAKLCRDFNTRYGVTVFQMLTSIRLTRAKSMLTNCPDIKLKSVSEACGFSDISYFCKMFRREYGISPKQSNLIQL